MNSSIQASNAFLAGMALNHRIQKTCVTAHFKRVELLPARFFLFKFKPNFMQPAYMTNRQT